MKGIKLWQDTERTESRRILSSEIVALIRELKDPRVKDKMLTVVRVM